MQCTNRLNLASGIFSSVYDGALYLSHSSSTPVLMRNHITDILQATIADVAQSLSTYATISLLPRIARPRAYPIHAVAANFDVTLKSISCARESFMIVTFALALCQYPRSAVRQNLVALGGPPGTEPHKHTAIMAALAVSGGRVRRCTNISLMSFRASCCYRFNCKHKHAFRDHIAVSIRIL